MIPSPPKWADRFLEWFCDPLLLEDLQGDLYEIFQYHHDHGRIKKANWLYIWLVFRSFRYSAVSKKRFPKFEFMNMTRNNFKIAFRVLWQQKLNTVLNLLGVAIGVTCFLLMGTYAKQELSYDQFQSKKDRLYRVWLKEDYGNDKIFFNSVTPWHFETTLEDNFPEIETALQFLPQSYLVGRGENRLNESVYLISPETFNVLDFTMLSGNVQSPLGNNTDIILSESFAEKYFGDNEAIGESLTLEINGEMKDFVVSGVFQDIRKESSISFNMAISNENNNWIFSEGLRNAWFNVGPETYVLIKENTAITSVEAKMQDMVMQHLSEEVKRGEYNIGFQPLTDIHLNTEIPAGQAPVGNPDYVYILGIIGILVLVIACVNYATLSIGQSIKRGKEVGIRKVLGAWRSNLIWLYLSESIIVAFLAMLLGVGFSFFLFPIFNELTGADVVFTFEWWHALAYFGIAVCIGIIAGIYPSLVLSGYKITSILKGTSIGKGSHLTRRGVVVFQFFVTAILLTSALIMRSQFQYMQTKDLGFDYNATISVNLYPDPQSNGFVEILGSTFENGKLLKAKLEKYPEVKDVGMGSHVFGTNGWGQLAYTDPEGTFRRFRILLVDPYYFETFNVDIAEGRKFEVGNTADEKQSIILNETAVKYFGLQDNTLEKKLPGNDFGDHRIVGVVKDFNFSSLHTSIEPLVIVQNPVPIVQGISDTNFGDSPIPKLVFKYSGSQLLQVRTMLNDAWASTFPNEELRFDFVDERMKLLYENEAQMNKLVIVATILAIIIASLGLFGLSLIVINSRTKEIGIRKVMGANSNTIFRLLAKNFIVQLLIGILISIPVTYWQMNNWLDDFAYRIDIGFTEFILSALIALVIAVVVVSFHTFKVSKINPVESLRAE